MILYPNAKINIGLNITEKRTDGFHNIESVFYPVYKLTDKLIIEESKNFELLNSGIDLNLDYKQNLIYKTFSVIKKRYNIPNLKINLQKNIPTGAGLGGGSADASFFLKFLNKNYNLKLTNEELENIADDICSDCPFFIKNTVKYVYEKGNKFKDIDLDLSNYFLVIIKPDIFISTAEAYSKIKPKRPKDNLLNLLQKPIEEWKNYIFNSFEDEIFKQYPMLNKIKTDLYSKGAVYAAMSGSGSSIFAIFNKKISINNYNNYYIWNNFM